MDWVGLIVSLLSGAIGGNVAGALMKDKSLGTAGNSVAGILGGGIVGAILQALGIGAPAAGATAGAINITSILSNLVGGGVGGGGLLAIIAVLRGTPIKK